MEMRQPTREELIEEIQSLKERLLEAEETIRGIQSGEVDAIVVSRPDGERLYTLTGADHGYRVLVESIIEGALILSSDNSIYYCNRTLEEMLGLPVQSIVGKKFESCIVPESRPRLMELITESRISGAAKGEFLMSRIDGTSLPVNVSLNRMRVEDFEGICAVVTDLSEQKRIEEELRRHRTELEILVNERTADLQREIVERKRAEEEVRGQREWLQVTLTSIGDAVIATDAEARVTFLNPVAVALTGWNEEEGRGKFIEEVFPIINEKTRKSAEDVVRRVLHDGRIALLSNNTALVSRDGREIPIEDSAAPIRDVAGELIGVVLVFHDVTEKRRNIAALRESEARFRSLFENSLDAIFLSVPDGQILAANPSACAMFQMTEEEICRVGQQSIIDSSDPRHAPALEERNRSGKIHQRELRYVRKNGTVFTGEESSVVLDGGTKAYVIIRDITDRKRMEEELLRSNEELEKRVCERTSELETSNRALMDYASKLESLNQELQEFAFIASHDLQEPLRKIQTFGNMLSRKYKDALPEEGQDFIDRMSGAAKRMSDLLQSLLNYSRLATQVKPYKPVDLGKAVRDVVGDLEFLIKRANGKVEVGILPVIHADVTQVRQLIQNLIGNSMKFRKDSEDPVVRISGRISEKVCTLFVEDNGIGFEEQYVDRIFRPFQQLHGRSDKYGGTGMGLAICRKIVERHGGNITAKSTPGQGATFIIQLPVNERQG